MAVPSKGKSKKPAAPTARPPLSRYRVQARAGNLILQTECAESPGTWTTLWSSPATDAVIEFYAPKRPPESMGRWARLRGD